MSFSNHIFYEHIIFDVHKKLYRGIAVKQGDTGSRGLFVKVIQNSETVDISDKTMTFYCEKPDKTRVYIDAVRDGDKYRVDLTNQVSAVPGIVECELTLRGQDGEQISNKTFKMVVDPSIQEGSIVSQDERGILDRAFELAEDLVPRIELLDIELLEDVQGEIEDARHDSVDDVTYDSLADRLNQDKLDYVKYLESELGEEHIIRSLPNGVKDEIRVSEGKLIKRVKSHNIQPEDVTNRTNGITIDYVRVTLPEWSGLDVITGLEKGTNEGAADITNIGKYLKRDNKQIHYYISTDTTLEQARAQLTGLELTYQLAEPEIIDLPEVMSPNTRTLMHLIERLQKLEEYIST